jgi:hypothetical protein
LVTSTANPGVLYAIQFTNNKIANIKITDLMISHIARHDNLAEIHKLQHTSNKIACPNKPIGKKTITTAKDIQTIFNEGFKRCKKD